jgi:hypothetical protein
MWLRIFLKKDSRKQVANTVEEATAVLEVGYEFHVEIEGKKLFRKRK